MANHKIKFGTDGWRAIVGEDFNENNVKLVANAIAKYVLDNFGLEKKIIIGYDPRNMADTFSMICAEVLAKKGFTILYSDKIIPTPVLAYNAKFLNACAVMFTASPVKPVVSVGSTFMITQLSTVIPSLTLPSAPALVPHQLLFASRVPLV